MEQHFSVFEFKLGSEIFRFPAASMVQAEKHREYARLHFMEILGAEYHESRMMGPSPVMYIAERRGIAGSHRPKHEVVREIGFKTRRMASAGWVGVDRRKSG